MDVFLDNANVETRNRKFIAKEWGIHGIEPLIMWIEPRKMRSDNPPEIGVFGQHLQMVFAWWVLKVTGGWKEILQQQKDG